MEHLKMATRTQIAGQYTIVRGYANISDDWMRRTHVLKGTDTNDPTAPFEDLGVISTPDLNYMIDVSVPNSFRVKLF